MQRKYLESKEGTGRNLSEATWISIQIEYFKERKQQFPILLNLKISFKEKVIKKEIKHEKSQ